MILAENLATNINWTLIATIVMALATAGMWYDAKKSRVTEIKQPLSVSGTPPGNSELQMSVKQLNARMKVLEDWRNQLTQKLEADKQPILDAGEDRARRIYDHLDAVRKELDEKSGDIPAEGIATLRNAGAIGGSR